MILLQAYLIHLQLTERSHLWSTPFEQLCT